MQILFRMVLSWVISVWTQNIFIHFPFSLLPCQVSCQRHPSYLLPSSHRFYSEDLLFWLLQIVSGQSMLLHHQRVPSSSFFLLPHAVQLNGLGQVHSTQTPVDVDEDAPWNGQEWSIAYYSGYRIRDNTLSQYWSWPILVFKAACIHYTVY